MVCMLAAANRIGLEQHLPDTAGIEFWALRSLWTTRLKFWQASTIKKKF
jgi:hypothetical protein